MKLNLKQDEQDDSYVDDDNHDATKRQRNRKENPCRMLFREKQSEREGGYVLQKQREIKNIADLVIRTEEGTIISIKHSIKLPE